jgi:hypothetical protein
VVTFRGVGIGMFVLVMAFGAMICGENMGWLVSKSIVVNGMERSSFSWLRMEGYSLLLLEELFLVDEHLVSSFLLHLENSYQDGAFLSFLSEALSLGSSLLGFLSEI